MSGLQDLHGPERLAAQLLLAEPDGRAATVQTLVDAARAARERGAPGRAVAYLRRALAEPPKPHARAEVELELFEAEVTAAREARDKSANGSAPVRHPRLIRQSDLLADHRPTPEGVDAVLLAELAMEGVRDGSRRADVVTGIARRALRARGPGFLAACCAACLCDDFPETDSALDGADGPLDPAVVRTARGLSNLGRGRVSQALEDLRGDGPAWAVAACHLERDEPDHARAALDSSPDPDDVRVVHMRGLILESASDFDRALEHLLAAGRDAMNPAFLPWRSDAARVALRVGDRDRALRLAEEEVILAEAFGTRRALGVAERERGTVTDDEATLARAVALLRDSAAQLELARGLLELGAHLRRAGARSASREPLREAVDLAERLGARRTASRATAELVASGARRPKRGLTGVDALTPSERRVAELVARGLTNREIAQSLFVTVRTVTTHLTHTYQKLEIDRREQLVEVVAATSGREAREEPARRPPVAIAVQPSTAPAPPVGDAEVPPITSLESARGALAAGRVDAVVDYCSAALRRPAADRLARASTAIQLGRALYHGGRFADSLAASRVAVDALGGDAPPALFAELETVRVCAGMMAGPNGGEPTARPPDLRLLAVAAGRAGWPLALLDGVSRWSRGGAGRRLQVLWRGAPTGPFDERSASDDPAVLLAVGVLVGIDEEAEARRVLAELAADARRRGSLVAGAAALGWAAELALRTGELRTAQDDAAAAVALCRRAGLHTMDVLFTSAWATAALYRDRPTAAIDLLASAPLDRLEGTAPGAIALFARGRIQLALGRPEPSIADLRRVGALTAGRFTDDPNVIPWRSTLARALRAAGATGAEAGELVSEELRLARQRRQLRGVGVALRARAELEPEADRVSTLREATARLSASPARIDLAGALLDLGVALGAAGSTAESREALHRALGLALGTGATSLARAALGALTAG